MYFTYHRVGRIPVLPALAAAGVLMIVGGVAVTTLVIAGVAVCGVRLLRVLGLAPVKRRPAFDDHETIEGVVVNRSPAAGTRSAPPPEIQLH